MRIAVCFHGQLRTGVQASKNIRHFFGEYFDKIDFFAHTWNLNTTRMPLNLVCYELPIQKVTQENHDAFKNIYRPINYHVEDQEAYWSRVQRMYESTGDLVHLWHSAYHSNQLKKSFELANNFKYDYVVRLRPDCIFPPDRKFHDDLEELAENKDGYKFHQFFGDTYHVSTSEIMDLACDFYVKGNFYNRHFWPMSEFTEYMKTNHGITPARFKDNRATILRQEYSYLDPIRFYWQISAINSFIYENVNFAKEGIIYTYENLKNPNWLAETKQNLRTIFGDEDIPANYFTFYKDLP